MSLRHLFVFSFWGKKKKDRKKKWEVCLFVVSQGLMSDVYPVHQRSIHTLTKNRIDEYKCRNKRDVLQTNVCVYRTG